MIDDPRLQIAEGIDGDFVLIGFPHHIGAKRENIRTGQDHGPDCLRRFLPKIGPLKNAEYLKNISKLTLSDYGNIHVDDDNNLDSLLEKLSKKVKIVKNKNHVPIVIGGSKDCVFGALEENLTVISIIANPDIQQTYDGKPSINSAIRASKMKLNVIYFGYDGGKLSVEDQQYLNNNCQGISLQQIRKEKEIILADIEQPRTQAGIVFNQLINKIKDNKIHLSISLESIDSAYCPGVSRPSIFGLTVEEIIEIVYLAGKVVVSIDITDYNPTIEDYRTGFLLGNLIYYFILSNGEKI